MTLHESALAEIDVQTGTSTGHASGDAPVILHAASGADSLVVPFGAFLLQADYARSGGDLVLTHHIHGHGHAVVVTDYFNGDHRPDLLTESGARVEADLAARLAGVRAPGQYAALGDMSDAQAIGKVSELVGDCTVTHVDGSKVTLAKDMPIFQGDVIETGEEAALAVTFIDQSTFSVGADARMVIDELVFDPSTAEGSSSVSLLQGVFVFVSGEIAASNPEHMLVKTPVATIGIRGTATVVEAHQEGELNRVVLLPEKAPGCVAAGGDLEHCGETVGSVRVFNQGGSVVLDEKFETTAIDSVFSLPADPTISSPAQVAFLLRQLGQVIPDSVGAVTAKAHGGGDTTLGASTPVEPGQGPADEGAPGTSDAGERPTGGVRGDADAELGEIQPAAGGSGGDGFNVPFLNITDGGAAGVNGATDPTANPLEPAIGPGLGVPPGVPGGFSSGAAAFVPGPPPPPAPTDDGTQGNEDEEVIASGGGVGGALVIPPVVPGVTAGDEGPFGDLPPGNTTPALLAIGGTFTGNLDGVSGGSLRGTGDGDAVQLELIAGVQYVFQAKGDFFQTFAPGTAEFGGTQDDPFLFLLAPDGVSILFQNDDGGTGFNSLITFIPSQTATFFLHMTAFATGENGTYTLFAEEGIFGNNLAIAFDGDAEGLTNHDVVFLSSFGLTVNFSNFDGLNHEVPWTNIEKIDASLENAPTHLIFDGSDIVAVTDSHKTLTIEGGPNTSITAGGNWHPTGTADFFTTFVESGTGAVIHVRDGVALQMSFTNGADVFAGAGAGSLQLNGLGGNDTIIGGSGVDILRGGTGADTLSGGESGDQFTYGAPGEGTHANNGQVGQQTGDHITDFATGSDHFTVDAAAFGFGSAVGTAVNGQDFFTVSNYDGSTPAGASGAYFVFDPNSHTLYHDDAPGGGYTVVATVQDGGTVVAGDIHFGTV